MVWKDRYQSSIDNESEGDKTVGRKNFKGAFETIQVREEGGSGSRAVTLVGPECWRGKAIKVIPVMLPIVLGKL